MAIKIENLRISPYTQKDTIKAVFGDTMVLTFTLPEAYADGDQYTLALDYERVLLPTMRPVCALTSDYTIAGTDITFTIAINTERFAAWASKIKKPTPIWMQIQRERGGAYETILLDDVLALPSVIDGANTVFPGTPLEDALASKLDKPLAEGVPGNILKLGSNGLPVWGTGGGGGGDVSWDDIQGKPSFATVATTGAYGDLTGKPTLAAVASTGDYDDLSNRPTIPTVGNGTITIVQGGVSKGSFSTNQASNATIEIDAGASDYIPTSEKGVAGGVATLDSGGRVPEGQITMERSIITIPNATTAYTFADNAVYKHTPASAPTYTLPTVTDATKTHTVIITVSFASALSCVFSFGGSTVAPLDSITITANDVVEYLCRYDSLQGKWCIACGKLNA